MGVSTPGCAIAMPVSVAHMPNVEDDRSTCHSTWHTRGPRHLRGQQGDARGDLVHVKDRQGRQPVTANGPT